MTTVQEYFGHMAEKPGNIGMELEVESLARITPFVNNIWLAKTDNSLRNHGTEFYTRNPINFDGNFHYRIKELTDYLKEPIFQVDYDSTRTSFHVHVNFTKHTMIQMWTQVFAYWLLEQPLMNMCGKSRCGNQFCLRCKDAEAQISMIANILQSPNSSRLFENDNLRYSSQNLKALVQFGSLEYRGMRGTHDPKVLSDWAHGMWYMSQSTKQFRDPKQLFDVFDKVDRAEFVRYILSPELANQVIAQPDYQASTSEGFDMLFDLVYDTDWQVLAQAYYEYVKTKPAVKKMDWFGEVQAVEMAENGRWVEPAQLQPAPMPAPRAPRRNVLGR